MRTIWNGSISFGLVTIPVGLAVAQQRKDVSFRTLHRECGTPIKQKRWCPKHEREVEADELVKGWEFTKGQYVMVEDSDLEAIALQRSHAVDIEKFVPVEEIDPIYFDRTYYLAPADAPAQRRPYALLLAAMKDTGLGAVGKFVLWGKENLCLIRPLGESLALETLYFAEDIRSRDEIDEAVSEVKVAKAELDMARQLVESLSGEYDPEEFRNEYRDQLKAMLEAKLEGKEIVAPEPEEPAEVIDLMEALKQSVAQAGKRESAEKKPARKKAAASSGRKRASARS
jgi:DNA end-binding protein Ku